MGRSLSNLICTDMAELAHYDSETVASEEAIRCIMALYARQGKLLHNIHIVHQSELHTFLQNTLNIDAAKSTRGHHQFLIEVGSRSKKRQSDPEAIHYCSLDLYFEPGKKPLAFVANHYNGYDGYYTEFRKIADELGVHFAIPGGAVFQADSVHCPIFSINNLLLTAKDDALPDLLDNIVGDTTHKTHTLFSWHELPPNYLSTSQSVSMLFKYVDHLKSKTTLPEEHSLPILEDSHFTSFLPASLYPDFALGNKVRNKAIKTLAAQMAGDLVVALEHNDEFDERVLIDLCYQQSYPAVHSILRKALEISKRFPVTDDKGQLQSHPLFELAFSFAVPMEFCFANKNFKDTFEDDTVLELIQKGLLNARDLFEAMVSRPREIDVNKTVCNAVKANLHAIKIVVSCLGTHPEANAQNIGALLISKNGSTFFKNPILIALFKKGLLDIEHIDKILAYKIAPSVFAALGSDAEKLKYLNKTFSLGIDLDSSDEDIFSIPMVLSRADAEAAIPTQKPVIDVSLLAQSMSKSIFTTEKNVNVNTVSQPEETLIYTN